VPPSTSAHCRGWPLHTDPVDTRLIELIGASLAVVAVDEQFYKRMREKMFSSYKT